MRKNTLKRLCLLAITATMPFVWNCGDDDEYYDPYGMGYPNDLSRECMSYYMDPNIVWWLDSEYVEIPAQASAEYYDYSIDSTPAKITLRGWELWYMRNRQESAAVDTIVYSNNEIEPYGPYQDNRFRYSHGAYCDTMHICIKSRAGPPEVMYTLSFEYVDKGNGAVQYQRAERVYRMVSNPYQPRY
jgi:hypothetical protein